MRRTDPPGFLRNKGIAASIAALALAAGASFDVPAQLRANEDPIENPDLPQACGLNVLMILDESGSIGNNDDDVRDAFKAFTAAIKNTSSSMAVAEFSKVARLPQIGPFNRGEYITVTDDSIGFLDDYVDDDYDPGGNTNWEDGLRMGRSGSAFAPRPDFTVPHLTVFITDGDPTRRIRGDRVTADEYLNKVPLSDNETTDDDKNDAADAAVANANNLKGQGSHILVIAVGNGVSSGSSLARIQQISGPDVYDGTGEFDISTDDVYREDDFSRLQDALREAAFQLCSPSVTVEKIIDLTPDPNSLDDALPGPNWEISGSVAAPGNGDFTWILPTFQDPGVNPISTTTDDSGFATFQWRPDDEVNNSGFTATETVQPGFVNDPDQTSCTFRTPDTNDQPLPLTSVGDGTFSTDIIPDSIVTCRFVNIAEPAPAITLEKYTDGADADTPTGPSIPRGARVNWTYVVTNTGNTRLGNIQVTDVVELPAAFAGEQQPFINCPKINLVQGESMTCAAAGVSGTTPGGNSFQGQYANLATVNATDSTGLPVSASDRSHYLEVQPGLDVQKSTNGQDADRQPGPELRVGTSVTWLYEVRNTGTEPLANVTVEDDDPAVTPVFQSGDANNNDLLDLDELWLYRAFGFVQSGQYANRAIATGDGAIETVTDEDPSHYFGAAPAVSIEKRTNGQDADLPPGPLILTGEPVNWTYVVTNEGNIPFTSWSVTDDQGVIVNCPLIQIPPGGSAVCSGSGVAEPGQYANVATARAGSPGLGPDVTATDPSHYFGTLPELTLEKSTNGVDADAPTGPNISVGDPVNWTYEVTNTGNVALEFISVIDSRLLPGDINCPSDPAILDPGVSLTCTATGTATIGQYQNLGIAITLPVNADPLDLGSRVFASDPSHYFGADPGVSLEKFTNGIDADTPADAPQLRIGSVVEWGYLVGNTGNESLRNVTVTDDQGAVPVLTDGDTNNNGLLDVGEFWLFEATGVAQAGPYANLGSVSAQDELGETVTDEDPSHYLGIVTDLEIEKSTNGQDADQAPGPQLAVGDPVTWEYLVTNNGNAPLQNLDVSDDQGVVPVYQDGDTNNNDELDPGETWRYTAQGTAIEGQYENLATANAISVDADGLTEEVEASDPSHYFGGVSEPAMVLEKLTNGEDADVAPGPLLEAGGPAIFIYLVANTGNVPLLNVTVSDDQGVTVVCQGGNPIPEIPVGGFGLCAGETTVSLGQYMNTGTATGTGIFGEPVEATDPSHHFGFDSTEAADPAVDIEKATENASAVFEDADTPPGPALVPGATVNFEYVVTNTGGVPLRNVTVSDDQGVVVSCPSGNPIPLLDVAASETCTGSATVAIGQYANLGTVEGEAPNSQLVTDSDPSHHVGAEPAIDIEKSTNGVDADLPADAIRLQEGTAVTWQYVVTNPGNEDLANVAVTDSDPGVTPVLVSGDTADPGVLNVGETWIFEATGTAGPDLYMNTGSAAAEGALSQLPVTDEDPSHYFGIVNDLVLEKSTNTVDADVPPGPQVPVGDPVTWEYLATNAGNHPLQGVQLVDDQGVALTFVDGDANNDGFLDPGETWRWTAQGTAVAGQYANLGTVTADSAADDGTIVPLQATDPSHYFGGANEPEIVIEKFTQAEDADTAPGPLLLVGDQVVFIYFVVNTGNIAVNDVLVSDDQGLVPDCVGGNPIPRIEAGAFDLCLAAGSVVPGQYMNIGTAEGLDDFGVPVSDTDPSHHFGFVDPGGAAGPSVDIEKFTNGRDADDPPGRSYVLGAALTFTYVVTNDGQVPVRNLLVTDDQGVAVSCPSGNPIPLLEAGESETCTGGGNVVEGDYVNIGAVNGEGPQSEAVSDEDPSHHRGFFGGVAIPALPTLGLVLLALLLAGAGLRAARTQRVRD